MGSYLLRRILYAGLTFLGITLATFTLIHIVPGDPISFLIGHAGVATIPPATLEAIRHDFHLDEPLPVQYLWWLRGAITLDFGRSIVDRRSVTDRILEKLPRTLQLNAIAVLLAALLGIPIGLWSATRSGRPVVRASAVLFFLLYSLPSFLVALLLMEFLSVRLGITSDNYLELDTAGRIADRLRHLVLPVLTLMYAQLAIFARFSKSALTEV